MRMAPPVRAAAMIACSWSGPRLHARSPRAMSKKGWAPIWSITLDPLRGTRLRRAWNSPQRRWSGVKVKPALAWTLPLAAMRTERASASQLVPRSIAAQAPPAEIAAPRAPPDEASPAITSTYSAFTSAGLARNCAPRHHGDEHPQWRLNQPNLLFIPPYAIARAARFRDSPSGEADMKRPSTTRTLRTF